MPALVQFLASGVNGAANGTATFVLRGTASSAASVLYNEFEATTQPGTNIITLDSNGAAEVYTDAYCDVTLKTSSGSTLRTVTIGNAATTVEVVSDSFTGTDYSGSPTAVSEPITLAAVLDKWNNSAGAIDWKVDVDGVDTNLSTAFSAIGGLFFNVKAYGALGDGVTDDTTAIGLAITAAASAGGGVVYFPASTAFYSFTTLPISQPNVTLMGTGPGTSVIKSSATSDALVSFTDNTVNTWKRLIGLGIQGTGANANALFQFENGQNIFVDNCEFVCSSYTGAAIRRSSTSGFTSAVIKNSKVIVGSSNTSVFLNAANDEQTHWKITDCTIELGSAFTGDVVKGPDFAVSGCCFNGVSVTSGSYTFINSVSNQTVGKYLGTFVNNTFIDGGSSVVVFMLEDIASGCDFTEDSNRFIDVNGTITLGSSDNIYSITHGTADAYKIQLGSRRGRTVEITHASTGTSIPFACVSNECVFVNYTGAGNLQIDAPVASMVNGTRAMFVILNNSGAQRDVVINYGETPKTYGPATSGSGIDLTLSPNDQERCVFIMEFMHNGSGEPLAFILSPVED